jgi:hypothetical protein
MPLRLLPALILTLALAVTGAALVSTSQARKMQWFVCGQNGVKIRTAPWTMGIEDAIGVRIKHGTKYFLRAGSAGPSCAAARKKLAHIATLRTRKAIRAASFGGLHCDVGQHDLNVLWVRPLGAWAGCWSSATQIPSGRYFFWELDSSQQPAALRIGLDSVEQDAQAAQAMESVSSVKVLENGAGERAQNDRAYSAS